MYYIQNKELTMVTGERIIAISIDASVWKIIIPSWRWITSGMFIFGIIALGLYLFLQSAAASLTIRT